MYMSVAVYIFLILIQVSFPLFWPTSLNDPLKFGCYEIYLDESIHKEGYSIFRITINSSLKVQ